MNTFKALSALGLPLIFVAACGTEGTEARDDVPQDTVPECQAYYSGHLDRDGLGFQSGLIKALEVVHPSASVTSSIDCGDIQGEVIIQLTLGVSGTSFIQKKNVFGECTPGVALDLGDTTLDGGSIAGESVPPGAVPVLTAVMQVVGTNTGLQTCVIN